MASLPPYSTYRTDNKQMMYPQAISHGNILTFTPPGFNQTLNVKFPDCRLAVCEKCKKNYKTRDMCRVRNSHTAEPWTTAFICITLDDTCTDEDGKYIDKPLTVRMVQWQPFCVKKQFDKKTPVCSACKKTNRTRSFCRERHKHRQLPWCTVYVLLSALDSADPSTLVAAPSKPAENGGKLEVDEGKSGSSEQNSASPEEKKSDSPNEKQPPEDSTSAAEEEEAKDTGADASSQTDREAATASPKAAGGSSKDTDVGDDINDIAESRTFLAKVSCHASSIHWLELAEFDATDVGTNASAAQGLVVPDSHMQPLHAMGRGGPRVPMPSMEPQQPQYFTQAHAQAMGYSAVNHHHQALKSHQQQYFLQMQQRQQQQFAAQAAWQAQYNQPGAQANGQPNAPLPGVSEQQVAQPPVTAGEAAAQQQKQGPNTGHAVAVAPQAPQPQPGHAPTAGAAAAAATAAQQQQGNPQWQMMYHQQVYQQQMQPGQPDQAQMPLQGQPPVQQNYAAPLAAAPQGNASENGTSEAIQGVNGAAEENDAKRTRYV